MPVFNPNPSVAAQLTGVPILLNFQDQVLVEEVVTEDLFAKDFKLPLFKASFAVDQNYL
jgi:hypothetical protein